MGYASKAGAAAVQAATVASEDSIRLEQELKYYFYQAMQDFDRQKFDEAMALLLHCEQIAPNDAAVNHYLGIMYSALEDERGFRYHLRAYQLCPKEYWYPYVVQLFNQDKKQEAIHELEEENVSGIGASFSRFLGVDTSTEGSLGMTKEYE